MVKAIIDIKKESNRILNIIKAQEGLRTKSEAIDFICKNHPEAQVARRTVPVQAQGSEHDLKKHREIYG